MLGSLRLLPRLLLVAVLTLGCPHPISFREGGYLPVAAMLPWLGSLDMAAMFALLFGVYFVLLLALSFVVFRRAPPVE
ncbi:MAG: hypothetical protein HKM89_07490 [Gemmatimonadales bacterium]|nr:hypothetical protein [Gemmatimonadales bacterium]